MRGRRPWLALPGLLPAGLAEAKPRRHTSPPAGFQQLTSSFATLWDDVLPPLPEGVWRENVDEVLRALSE